jgi:hypothetical protein
LLSSKHMVSLATVMPSALPCGCSQRKRREKKMIDVEKVDPLSLPSIAVSDHSLLPANQAIYFAVRDSDEVVSIGKAHCLVKRWQKHHRLSQFELMGPLRIAWIACDSLSRIELHRAEQEGILRFHPRLDGTRARLPLHLRSVSQKRPREERYRQNTVPWICHEPTGYEDHLARYIAAQKGR